jgi:hypothetical protein
MVLHIQHMDKYSDRFLLNINCGNHHTTNLPMNQFQLQNLLKLKQPALVEVYGIPSLLLVIDMNKRKIQLSKSKIHINLFY